MGHRVVARALRAVTATGIAVALLGGVGSVLVAPAGASTVRYVAPNGNDANAGTATAPMRTIKHALTTLRAGDTLVVRGGTYVENVTGMTLASGTSTAPITVQAYPGERPVVQGLLWVTNPNWWVFNGLNVTWNPANTASEHMVKLTGGSGWVFENAEVWGAHSYAGMLVAGTPTNWRVTANCIHDTYPSNSTNQDHLIYANSGLTGSGGVIDHNLLFNATNGEAVKLAGPSSSSGGTNAVTVRNNTMYNTAQDMLIAWASTNNVVRDNLIGKTGGTYGAIRGYQLNGSGNVATHNYAYSTRSVLLNDGGYAGVRDGGGNALGTDPQFDALTCSGFHPRNSVAAGFGRYTG
jgi:hypothetical protein